MNRELAAAGIRDVAKALGALASAIEAPADAPPPPELLELPDPGSWRTRLWTEPADRRIGVDQVAEALGRSTSWVYKHVKEGREGALPVRRFGGELVFIVGELRGWLEDQEEIVNRPPRAIRAVG